MHALALTRTQTLRLPVAPAAYVVRVVGLGLVYWALGAGSLAIASLPGNVSPVWAPTGLALAVLIRGGVVYWPGVTLGALLVNGADLPAVTTLLMAAGNTAEAVVGALLFLRLSAGQARLDRVHRVLALALAAAVATLISATVGVAALWLGGVLEAEQLLASWRVWWAGDALGALVLTPVLLSIDQGEILHVSRAVWVERAVLLTLLLATNVIAFTRDFGEPYLLFPLVVWAALRFHTRGAAFLTLVISIFAVIGTRAGLGAFAIDAPTERMWLLDLYLAAISLTGLVLAAVVSERDQVSRENAELTRSLTHSVSDLRAANKELEAFTYSVSHDLRAPLRNIDGFSRMLERKQADVLDERGLHYLDRIRFNARAMGQLIDELLVLSRLQRQPLNTRPTDLRAALDDALAQLESSLAERSVHLEIGRLPTLDVDRALVTQVFANLLGNALKFTRERTVARIDVGSEVDEPGNVVIHVRDNGVGFDMEYSGRMFAAFQRMHRAEEYEGSGVGLAIVASIVERHGGRVWAEGRPGVGACIYFTLEREHDDAAG